MTISPELQPTLVEHLLSIADDKFILAQRNADWTGLAPILEEDIAFSSMAQDDLSHASALYDFIAKLTSRDANAIAYGRKPNEYRCAQFVEPTDEFDWAAAIARQFYFTHFDALRLERLSGSKHGDLAALASRILAEARLHTPHADGWIARLVAGGTESQQRIRAALDKHAAPAATLLEPIAGLEKLEQAGLIAAGQGPLFDQWSARLQPALRSAGATTRLTPPAPGYQGGRHGLHSHDFAAMLDELSEVYRVEPQAAW